MNQLGMDFFFSFLNRMSFWIISLHLLRLIKKIPQKDRMRPAAFLFAE